MLNLLEATRIIECAMIRARALHVGICVAVCNNDGKLIALNRMDNAVSRDVDRQSIGKAIAAAMIGRPSDELATQLLASGRHLASLSKLVIPQGRSGGLPIIKGGIVQGGCGVSGASTAGEDVECAQAGIAALDVERLPTFCH